MLLAGKKFLLAGSFIHYPSMVNIVFVFFDHPFDGMNAVQPKKTFLLIILLPRYNTNTGTVRDDFWEDKCVHFLWFPSRCFFFVSHLVGKGATITNIDVDGEQSYCKALIPY